MLLSNPYVIVISLDISKAFDILRHTALLDKLNQRDIPDTVYNWMVDVLSDRSHCTVYGGQTSSQKSITAGIIHGSGIGPAAYVVTAGDLKPITVDNKLIKFADDAYLIINSSNIHTRSAEVDNIEHCAQINNLKLNRYKFKEIIFTDYIVFLALICCLDFFAIGPSYTHCCRAHTLALSRTVKKRDIHCSCRLYRHRPLFVTL